MTVNTREFDLLKRGPEQEGYKAGWYAAMEGMPCEVPPPRGHDCAGHDGPGDDRTRGDHTADDGALRITLSTVRRAARRRREDHAAAATAAVRLPAR